MEQRAIVGFELFVAPELAGKSRLVCLTAWYRWVEKLCAEGYATHKEANQWRKPACCLARDNF